MIDFKEEERCLEGVSRVDHNWAKRYHPALHLYLLSLGSKLPSVREALGFTQDKMADAMQYNREKYKQIENSNMLDEAFVYRLFFLFYAGSRKYSEEADYAIRQIFSLTSLSVSNLHSKLSALK